MPQECIRNVASPNPFAIVSDVSISHLARVVLDILQMATIRERSVANDPKKADSRRIKGLAAGRTPNDRLRKPTGIRVWCWDAMNRLHLHPCEIHRCERTTLLQALTRARAEPPSIDSHCNGLRRVKTPPLSGWLQFVHGGRRT